MKNVLLATDFSKNADNAIDYAVQLFGTEDVKYALLNTYEEPKAATSIVVSMNDMLRKESLKGLHEVEDRLVKKYPGINLEVRCFYGSLPDTINKLAVDEEFEYVAIGKKGISALESFVMGSNAMSIVKYVKIPTLLIPENAQYNALKSIAFAADYEHLEDLSLIQPLKTIVKDCDAELKIVNVQSISKDVDYDHAVEGSELHNVLEGVNHQFFTEHNDDVVTGIYNFVKSKDIQLLSMIARKHSFFDRLFHKSITKEVTNLADTPYLILHE